MQPQEIRDSVRLNRRAALSGAGAVVAALGLGLGRVRGAAQATDLASHPIVGAWMVTNPPEGGPVMFHADGTMTQGWSANYVDPTLGVTFQGPGMGVWEPVAERGVHVTTYQVLTDTDAKLVGTFMIDSVPEVSEDGQTFTDRFQESHFVLRDAAGAILSEFSDTGGMVLTAVRITPGAMIVVPAAAAEGTPAP
jgi:hypothetical protein